MSSQGVCIPNTRKIGFVSSVNGIRYQLYLGVPYEAEPEEGYATLYILDGNEYFATAVAAVRASRNAPAVLVVGVGYPEDAKFANDVLRRYGNIPQWLANRPRHVIAQGLQRIFDFTPPASQGELARQNVLGMLDLRPEDVGGVSAFLRIVEEEVKPIIAAQFRINRMRDAIFGHSFGGLAVSNALFVSPHSFRSFIVSSPSLWWNRESVLRKEAAFANAVAHAGVSPRVLITIGGDERLATSLRNSEVAGAEWKSLVKRSRMFSNARALSMRLRSLRGSPEYKVEFAIFEKQDHGIAGTPAIARGVRFAFDSDAGGPTSKGHGDPESLAFA